ncbi:hypothetical protein [Escherichia albertii]|uniref:hypothetical protein n=1 Tax=Escherichia albertii TaxID=208962 RepID=UPI000BF2C92B|nr:hypothetical protein [Escherichia albertii]PFF94828.1 hypothetical protein CRH02_16540 [Escherichia albertii]
MATATEEITAITSAYRLIMRRVIINNACDALNTTKPLSAAKNDIISGLRALQECAECADDYAAYMVIDDVIKDIESGESLRSFV